MPKTTWPPSTLLSPAPAVLVSCGTLERPNVLTVAWTGIANSRPAMTYVSIRPQRHSHAMIESTGEFAINLTTPQMVRAADLCGMRTGAKLDKFRAAKLTPVPASKISAPILAESPVSLECRVKQVLRLGSHDMFLAEIVAVDVEESCIDEKGRLSFKKCGIMAYSHGEYFALGKRLGSFGCSVKKKRG